MSLFRFISIREKLMKAIFFGCAFFSLFALLLITVYLFANGLPFMISQGSSFFFGMNWSPLSTTPSYGILPMVITTIYITAFSLIIGSVIGIFTSIALYRFIPKKISKLISQIINVLAGIPSVIYGLFGMSVIVPFLRDYLSPNGVGYGILAGSLILAIMILPTIVSVSYDSLNAVDESYFEGAIALGASSEMATFRIMVPSARSGILAGVVLAAGRALGETMALIMVIGGSSQMPTSLFQSVRSLTANIAMGAMELQNDKTTMSALIATGVVLFLFALLLNLSLSFFKKGDSHGKA
jgi:phosphate transport system permease protein